jgi:hypothetical protein
VRLLCQIFSLVVKFFMRFLKRTEQICFLHLTLVSLALMLAAAVRTSSAQEMTLTNRALKLDGTNSYVMLPPDIFTNLTEATIETWAKWQAFGSFSRVFEFGAGYQSVSVFNHSTNSDLRFNIYPRFAKSEPKWMFTAYAKEALRTNEWVHIAAVSGSSGMKLYVNGRLAAQHTNKMTFADIHAPQTNYLGRGLARGPTDRDFRGEIDEVRVWDHPRSVTQIRDNMFKRLSGKEEGLTHLWNFDDSTVRDSGPKGHHGKLMGKARIGRVDLDLALAVVPKPPAPVVPTNAAPAPAPIAAAPASNPSAAQAPIPIHVAVTAPTTSSNAATIAIICSAISVGALVVFLMLLFRRNNNSGQAQLAHNAPAQLGSGDERAVAGAPVDPQMRERALADLTDFAKQSLVQGLYTQRAALLEVHQKAQEELAALEAWVVALRLPERIAAYEKRIAELEGELATRGDELRELTLATLNVLREKLEEEKKKEVKPSRFN